MARLPRLAVAGFAHLVLLRGHNGQIVFGDDIDRRHFLVEVHAAFARERVALHAYALPGERAWLVCTPAEKHSLSRAMQSLGRVFAAGFNRRHERTGALWDGRFRASVIESGATLLEVLVFVDQAGWSPDTHDASSALGSSAHQHLGFAGVVPLTDAREYWALGNTPFERAAAYVRLCSEPLALNRVQGIRSAAEKGWAIGSPQFLSGLQEIAKRPVAARPRGRPRKNPIGA